ncbi:MAG: molybdenum cofactor biosysynthesis protein [Opitutales bacterium]|nr:molybdenum cofactor biosysynthesis protein [Opitutales bacterium]|tara:strand:+ start:552 stop:1058 length:507 start_codon:yes stop_codon:yes gene_type:complete
MVSMIFSVEILGIYVSPDHDFRGHHGKPRGNNPITKVVEAECVTGQGIRGDRYFGFKENYKAQITFFDQAVHEAISAQFEISPDPSVYRRNVMLAGIDLNELIGKRFSIGDVRFEGVEECTPCYWMDQAVAPGVEEFLKNRGGLRARILEDGILKAGSAELRLLDSAP